MHGRGLMELLLPLMVVLVVKHSDARTHSLRYFRLGISYPGYGIPEFISVGYVDSHPITSYDSVTRQKEPRAPWMAENLAPDHWERHTQLLRGWQQTFKVELKQLQRHYNHSGFHTYQRMMGCELLEDGTTTGFLQYAYDGQDFIIFDKDTLSWMAMDNVAHITKQAWEANQHELQYQKNWLEEECIDCLKRYLEYGKDTLQRTELETMLLAMKAVGFILLGIALAGVGFLAWRRKTRERNGAVYFPPPDH
ncbi:major histocompatibility complex class I-related gene protein isoform X2 [Hippopotamus amphibius kiboko]|uniref:major histocompatibility complex class I-related gene protein isoform X2 n=1 Tax=Hippopotamus amphibius kiboko TaxID=575201 RepID=UPI002599DBF3|nr:major histocompatibility complex class I-related gene protein isoform X2 [Hippopotamus amphibius kiboko]